MYCPNQWYYKRVYGAKSLTQMYEALDIEHSEHTEHFTKGMKHHTSYHFRYRIMKVIRIIILIGLLILIFKRSKYMEIGEALLLGACGLFLLLLLI